MITANHKSESPAATGLCATYQNSHTESTPAGKRLATTIAQLALAGHAVHKLETGFLVSRWGQTRHCPDFPALVGFARQIGVKA